MKRGGLSGGNFPARADLVASTAYGSTRNNQNSYRWNSIASVTISATTYQAICFWNSSGNLVIGKRTLDGAWTLYTYNGGGGLATIAVSGTDNHDVAVIGIDPDGFIHICYDMHAEALKYRKSDAAIDSWTGALGAAGSMVGTNESAVTYPTFINDPAGNLYFLFRDGTAGNGDLFFYKYTHGTTTWAAAAGTGSGGKLIDGKGHTPDRSPYWDHPCFDSDFGSGGFLHLSWHWRVTGDTAGANRDVCYVRWDGTSWTQADGSAQTVPITSANCETVDSTGGENLGLTSFNSLFSDSDGNPHIVYAKTNTNRFLYHAHHDGASWTVTQITTTTNASAGDETTSDTALIPSIAINRSNNHVFVFYRDVKEEAGLWMLKSTNFTTWTKKRVYPYSVGWWSPKFDYVEFDRSGNLYFPIEEFHGTLLSGVQSAFPVYVWKATPGSL